MSDLISRSALIEKINSMDDDCNLFRWRSAKKIKEGLAHIINHQPTAYDLDEVVEELEKEVEKSTIFGMGGISYNIDATKIIDIVRKGGVK